MRGFKEFGPMFKMIGAMTDDLLKFMVLWSLVIIMFASVSLLLFGHFKTYETLTSALIYWF
jgi:hypothetical protein